MIACGAGPIVDGKLKLSNAAWLIDGREVARKLKLSGGLLLNDFEAQALSLPVIPDEWTKPIGPRLPSGAGPRLILGPGTGLGVAALIEASGRHTPVSSEFCHMGFGPATRRGMGDLAASRTRPRPNHHRERRLRAGARARLSRPAPRQGRSSPSSTIPPPSPPPRSPTPRAKRPRACRLYWRIVGRLAGDAAIAFVARGGVTLAGGVLPRIVDLLDEAAFRAAFEDKAPVDALARAIPTRLVMHADAVLVGMAAIAAAPERYAIDYAGALVDLSGERR